MKEVDEKYSQRLSQFKKVPIILIAVFIVSIIFSAVVLVVYFAQFSGELTYDQAAWGGFGDYVGGVLNPIFGMLSLFALLVTIYVQTRELTITSVELVSSLDALKDQSKILNSQAFESTFFKLLELNLTVLGSMFISRNKSRLATEFQGEECFREFLSFLTDRVDSVAKMTLSRDDLIVVYNEFFDKYNDYFGTYFVNFENLLRYTEEKCDYGVEIYVRILKSQLSQKQIFVLFFHALSDKCGGELKQLIEKYGFLNKFENFGCNRVDDLMHLYSRSAYG